jgi:hypothetical protein
MSGNGGTRSKSVYDRLHEDSNLRAQRRSDIHRANISLLKTSRNSFQISPGSLDYLNRRLRWISLGKGADMTAPTDVVSDIEGLLSKHDLKSVSSLTDIRETASIVSTRYSTEPSSPARTSRPISVPSPSPRRHRQRVPWSSLFRAIIEDLP